MRHGIAETIRWTCAIGIVVCVIALIIRAGVLTGPYVASAVIWVASLIGADLTIVVTAALLAGLFHASQWVSPIKSDGR